MILNTNLAPTDKSASAVDTAVDTIRLAIITRNLLPGEPLRQEDIARQLHLSRVPIREALSRLEGEGLAVRVKNVGYFVAKLEPDRLSQLYRVRGALERELLSNCRRATADELGRLEELNTTMQKAVDDEDVTTLLHLNRDFHFAIFALAALPFIEHEAQRVWTMSSPYQILSMTDNTRRAVVPKQHAAMIAALAEHDLERLVELSAEHRAVTEQGVLVGSVR
jgi:DNA-binding GntR family transcriptional regulator